MEQDYTQDSFTHTLLFSGSDVEDQRRSWVAEPSEISSPPDKEGIPLPPTKPRIWSMAELAVSKSSYVGCGWELYCTVLYCTEHCTVSRDEAGPFLPDCQQPVQALYTSVIHLVSKKQELDRFLISTIIKSTNFTLLYQLFSYEILRRLHFSKSKWKSSVNCQK